MRIPGHDQDAVLAGLQSSPVVLWRPTVSYNKRQQSKNITQRETEGVKERRSVNLACRRSEPISETRYCVCGGNRPDINFVNHKGFKEKEQVIYRPCSLHLVITLPGAGAYGIEEEFQHEIVLQ